MERVIAASLRGILTVATLVALAACNQDGSAATGTPSGNHLPPLVEQPNTPPAGPTDPVDPPSPPPLAEEPSNPEEPTEPEAPPVPGDPNVAPQIAGAPASEVQVGASFNFQPAASDADGDNLSFSIQSKPAWASFNARTGRLWGTPSEADVGSHEQILIRVSDGATTRALPQFAISVVQHSTGSATLAWDAPTENTDGSALVNLKGYKIHYGTTSGQYQQVLTVNNAGLTRYVIDNLAPGTYYFAISALTTTGVQSALSAEAVKAL